MSTCPYNSIVYNTFPKNLLKPPISRDIDCDPTLSRDTILYDSLLLNYLMRLRRIRIKNFRSIFTDDDKGYEDLTMELSPDGNYIVGPNNVGKSNILRALRLALRPESAPEYKPDLDQPKQMDWAYPTITLDFKMERQRSPYKTLLKYVENYERSIVGEDAETFAENDRVRFYVQYGVEEDSRDERFQAKGEGAIKGDEELLEEALEQFHETVRLVDIESGEDLDSLLQRGFNELFTRVLSERFRDEISEAEELRDNYIDYLSEDVLGEVDEYITEELGRHLSGINDVEFEPNLKAVDEALADLSIEMNDSVHTPLSSKGTGVRSALIQMIMAFIADASRRSIIFAVEEPEAFLHPERHEELGHNLESFTSQSDISLLVTTHSPFILTNNTSAAVFTASKTGDGRTQVKTERVRQLAINNAKNLLTGADNIPETTDIIDSINDECNGILVVEGWTDKSFLETAAEVSGLDSPLRDLHIIDSEGANEAMKDAVVMKSVYGDEKPVFALLDDDEHGKSAYSTLTSKLGFQSGSEVLTYREWQPRKGADVEAEDLFSTSIIDAFIDKYGESAIDGWKKRNDGRKHIEISSSAKGDFATWVGENADQDDCEMWIGCIQDIRNGMGLDN
ncbi:ATP-dependent nuclease [Halomicrobium salinisoli]|uniref:ATP-dependent nuclease n=1 Tax=Halomicrobium salinisoli TaxID=2878391 RepID=UPI001CF08A0D|nr:AAA family ATPase [Halomicrobium salinisoli]